MNIFNITEESEEYFVFFMFTLLKLERILQKRKIILDKLLTWCALAG